MADFTDHGRPTTPTGSSRTGKPNKPMRAINTSQPKQETFFDDETPVDRRPRADTDEYDPLRDSHDLSFAEGATVRDSVVDNMLLSLDQFSTGSLFGSSAPQYNHYGEDDFFLRDNSYRQPGARHRGHTHTSSRSSDYDLYPDDPARYTAHHSRARRSNSSNNIGAPARKGSVRDMYSGRQPNGAYGQLHMGHLRGGGRQGSKGSGSSSMDFNQSGILGNQRLGFGKRSASFDHSVRHPPLKVESVLDRGRMAYQTYPDEYDAAPEPNIPAGPRRAQEPPQSPIAYPPQPSYAAPQAPAPAPRRRGSVRSNASYRTLRKNKSQPGPNMRAQAQEFVNASTLRDLPPVPPWHDSRAASPTVASPTARVPLQPTTAAPRPGFFRRVFGGGSSKSTPQLSNPANVSNPSQVDAPSTTAKQPTADISSIYSQARPRTTPNNTTHASNHQKSLPKAPPTASSSHAEPQPSLPPSLNKKPSSFFRRRKKSVSENMKPPVMDLDYTPPPRPVLPPQPSPGVSSLRKVMNPYLSETGRAGDRSQETRADQSAEHVAKGEVSLGFSPGYKPHKDATVRTVKSSSYGNDQTPPPSRSEQLRNSQLSNSNSPKMKLKMKHGKTPVPTPQEDTFLADSSSCNEDRSGRATPTGEHSGAEEVRKTSTGPTSTLLKHSGEKSGRKPSDSQRADHLSPHDQPASRSGSVSQSASDVEDEGWIITEPTSKQQTSSKKSAAEKRVWLDTTLPDTLGDTTDDLQLPLEAASSSRQSLDKPSPQSLDATSPNEEFHSATSLPIVQVESRESASTMPSIEDRSLHTEPTDAERERAFQIFSGDDSSSLKAQAAAMLGDVTLSSTRTRKAFIDLFDWTGMNILAAMRDLCGKIILKAETQQVDRILMSLSERWCECNSNHGFKAVDVVHTICYSILLLNTDLHLADIESRMTRSQFVRNTLPTVTRVCQDAVQSAGGETLRPQSTHFRRPSLPWNDKSEPSSPNAEAGTFPGDIPEEPAENRKSRSRLSIRPPARSGSEGLLSFDSATTESNTLVNSPYNGPMRGWEFQVETVLKEFYDSIRKQRLPLHGSAEPVVHHQQSSNNLSVSSMLRRTPSVLSKAPSDHASYRGRSQASMGNRWASKNRSKQRLYPSSTVASSRTSLDEGSVFSPAGSSTWSRYSYGKTGTSMSVDSLGSHFAAGDYQQAIGFANALSQAIIREEGMTISSDEEFARVAPLLEDETLELVGAPWAKEGILKHKHHLEATDKKAKDRAWSECFAVVEKGCMRLFSFSMNSKAARQKSKLRPSAGSVVGGGNWMDNAEALESFQLRQTIASALPPPGYSKTRPHVFALSLPNGAVHLFHVGTPDICREFVCTINYWSARLSKEPLMGGVSSMEYGWGENVINPALIRQDSAPSVQGHMPRPSVTSSLRSSMDHATGAPKARLPGDKAQLSDWSPPASSMMASTLMEVDQLRALTDYVKNIESELAHHNELRAPLLIAFSPRHPNAAKAMANWERKSQYLLREIVKFRTYIDTLSMAQAQKQKIYAEREAHEGEMAEERADADASGSASASASASARLTEDDGAKDAPEPAPTSQLPIANPSLPPAFLLHP